MTYRELLDKLIAEHADDKGIIRGEICIQLFRISQLGEKNGYDTDCIEKEGRESPPPLFHFAVMKISYKRFGTDPIQSLKGIPLFKNVCFLRFMYYKFRRFREALNK